MIYQWGRNAVNGLKEIEKGIYLSSKIYPNTNGGTQHNIGTCEYLTRWLDMTMVSLLDREYEKAEVGLSLAEYHFDVSFYYQGSTKGYKERFCLIEPIDEKIVEDIDNQVNAHSVSWLFFTLKMIGYAQRIQKLHPDMKCIYISHNAEFMNITDDVKAYDRINHVKGLRHWLKLIRANAFMMKEKEAVRRSDKVFSISNHDSELLAERYRANINRFVLNKPMIGYQSRMDQLKWKDENYTHKLLIVGNMSWYPTVHGTLHFVDHIYPKLKNEDKDIQLFIVGAKPAQELRDMAEKDYSVTVTGYVKSVDEYYEQCDIAIVPIYEGTGAKLKVLEALGNHIPVVMTAYVAKDYDHVQQAAIVAKDDEEMIAGICKLMCNEKLRKQVSEKEKEYYSGYMRENVYVDRFFEGCKENSTTE